MTQAVQERPATVVELFRQALNLPRYQHTGEGYARPQFDIDCADWPAWKGPHQDRELAMMLHGVKPAAIVPREQYEAFAPYVASGRFVNRSVGDSVLVVLAGEEERLALLLAMRQHPKPATPTEHQLVWGAYGVIFGYTDDHIEQFCERNQAQ